MDTKIDPSALQKHLTTPSPRLLADVHKLKGNIMVLGAAGKMGPTLCVLLQNALQANKQQNKVIAVSRFSNKNTMNYLQSYGIEVIAGDLLDATFLSRLPDAPNIIFMAGQKFGTSKNEGLTWVMNAYLPGMVASQFSNSRMVVFSTGNVYPLSEIEKGGATESTAPEPVGEYAQSCLGRERIFEYFSAQNNTPTLIFRLNYALDLRYGVLNDIGQKIWQKQPIDLKMGYVNIIWQGDANEFAIRSLLHTTVPANIVNVTGAKTHAVKDLAKAIGSHMGIRPQFKGTPSATALLSSADKSNKTFGLPSIDTETMCRWTAEWIMQGGDQLGKPTHFQTRDGKF